MLLVVDNYDSFTYNLVQYLGELGADLAVRRNDAVTVDEVARLAPHGIVISPGPGDPTEAGVSVPLLRAFAGRVPILGVCLGHQCIGAVFGGVVERAPTPVHGKTSWVHHDGRGVFAGLASPFEATRYHSLVVRRAGLPDCLEVSAWTDDGLVMGLRHREAAVEGVQFHPESILTDEGKRLLANFLDRAGGRQSGPTPPAASARIGA
jgi:anthranilate synthase component 2